MSLQSSSVSSLLQMYRRCSGVPSSETMRKPTLARGRFAANSDTGTDTSPNVIVPDQNGRAPPAPPSSKSSSSATGCPPFRRFLLAAPDRGEARRQRLVERSLVGLLRTELHHLRLPP